MGVFVFLLVTVVVVGIVTVVIAQSRASDEADRLASELTAMVTGSLVSIRDAALLTEQLASNRSQLEQRQTQLAQATHSARATTFQALRTLHSESVQIANAWYKTYDSAKTSLRTIRGGRDRLEAELRRVHRHRSSSRGALRARYSQEINRLQGTIGQVESTQAKLASEVERGLSMVRRHNARTHELKLAIRDNCGQCGLAWYNELERRTAQRRIGR